MIKGVVTLLLASVFAFVFILTGCGSTSTPSNSTTTTEKSTAASEQTSTNTTNEASSANSEPVKIVTSFSVDELTDDVVTAFESKYPNINVKRVTLNNTKLMAMVAAGSAPDIWRIDANQLPGFVSLGMLLDLDKYVDNSEAFKNKDDFADCWKLFQYDGKTFGQGPQYGIPHSWGMDHMLWVNKKIFAEKGIPVPSPDQPITYTELFDIAKKIVTKDAKGKITTYGFATWCDMYKLSTIMMKKMGKSFWSDNYTKPNFSSEEGKKVIKYWVDFAKSYACHSTLNPIPSGWGGPDFLEGKLGIFYGNYGFSSFITSNPKTKDHVEDFVLLPAPIVEGGQRISWVIYGAMGGVINKNSKHPDEAFKFLEWFMSGEQAENRTKAAWGLPPFKSMMSLLPVTTEFDKQCLKVNNDEMQYFDPKLEVNPYVVDDSVGGVFKKYTDEVLYDKMSVDEACKKIDEELAALIQEGKEIAGIE
jgi:multiple sugar transport system substrate-binding protein